MPKSTRKQQNILPFEKGGQGGISIVRNSLNPPGPLCERGRYFWGLRKGEIFLAFAKGGDIPKLFSDRMPERIACRQVSENSRTFPPFEKGGSGGISIVILVTQKSVIPSSPPRLPCHPGKHQRARHSSNPPPPPAVFPTADSSPRFARFGMTRERNCHPEERQPPVSSRGASTSRVIPRSVSDEGSAVENTDGRMA
jgi:hypothetical protein